MNDLLTQAEENSLVQLAQNLVRIKSLSGGEGELVKFLEKGMLALGYDEVRLDSMGNLLGKMGGEGKSILLDAHVDTVDVPDAQEWSSPPFSGEIKDGYLFGRGSVDMKGAAAAAVLAGAASKRLGLAQGKTVYVSCTVNEEDCDGENLKNLFSEVGIQPGCVVICEPSNNRLALGHKGKAQVSIKTHGVSAHGSAPEKGVNAVYGMAEVIQRVEKANLELLKNQPPRGTLVLSRISSISASLNAVPSECGIYLDRRLAPGETLESIKSEMDALVEGKDASWEVEQVRSRSWTGREISYMPFHLAWKIGLETELARQCTAAYIQNFGRAPEEYGFWDFSTNAVTPVGLGIPTIGFGPGDPKLAHMLDERCAVQQIIEACGFYISLIGRI